MTSLTRSIFAILLALLFILAAIFGGPSNGLEATAMRWMAEVRGGSPELTRLVAALTTLGGAIVTLSLAALASLWLLLRRAPALALVLAATVLGERLLVDGFKEWIGRPRPPLDAVWTHSLAYPSGHSANSMTAFLTAALLASPPAWRRPAMIVALAMAILIGLSRIYLGVHWPSDVIGGWALGLLTVLVAVAVCKWSGALRLEPQHDIIGRHGAASGEDKAP